MRILVKGKLYYIRLPNGYIRAKYLGSKEKRRTFITVNGNQRYTLNVVEVARFVSLVPKRARDWHNSRKSQ